MIYISLIVIVALSVLLFRQFSVTTDYASRIDSDARRIENLRLRIGHISRGHVSQARLRDYCEWALGVDDGSVDNSEDAIIARAIEVARTNAKNPPR